VTEPPPAPRGPWPENPALHFSVGDRVTLLTKTGDQVTGAVTARSTERVWLTGPGGTFCVWTGSILTVTTL
jgi:hypothetical protein